MKRIHLLFFLLIVAGVNGQSRFDKIMSVPVSEGINNMLFPWAGGINFPKVSPIDMNGDGLDDIFSFDNHNNRILTFTNNGNTDYSLAWDYSPQFAFQFPPVNAWAFLYDYNCDGKADFFTFSSVAGCSGIAAYKNVTTPGGLLQWSIVDSCLDERYITITQHIFTNSIALPHFNDIDGDGDMDILGYNTIPNGRILFHKNYSMENYGTCDSLDFVLESLCWGNFQLKIGGSNSVGCFHCPCRESRPPDEGSKTYDNFLNALSESEPQFDPTDAARRDDTVSGIFALDTDGDNNLELLVGDIASSNTLMVHNGGTEMDTQDTLFPSYNTPAFFNGFHYHSYFDTDNDNKKDLLVISSENTNKDGMWLYKNTGTNSSPVFTLETTSFLQGEMIDAGQEAAPVLFDYDDDGLLDLVIGKGIFDNASGQYNTGLYLYKNIGSAVSPAFSLANTDFAGLSTLGLYQQPVYPAFGDLDNDGDKDMLLGLKDGKMDYFENVAGSGNPALFTGPLANYMSIDVSNFATPQLYDIDRDGLLDIISGSQRGFINYFKNRGTASAANFNSIPTEDTLGCIVLQGIGTTDGFTVPFLYDSMGTTRLLVAWEKGNIFQYTNIDGNLTGCFNLAGAINNPVETSRIKFNLTVSGGDLNGDSLTDIVIGHSTGGVELRYQMSPTAGISEYDLPYPSIEVFPNPVSDELHIRIIHQQNFDGVVSVFNAYGKLVAQIKGKGQTQTIETSSWANGVYLVRLTIGNDSVSRKVVVYR